MIWPIKSRIKLMKSKTTNIKACLVPYSGSDSNNSYSESDEQVQPIVKDPCQQCKTNEHKYKCPRCEMLTCSLSCVKQHKEQTGCCGVKEPEQIGEKLIRVNEMNVNLLRKEMKFLEDGINLSNKAKKENTLAKAGITNVFVRKQIDPKI